MSQENKVVECKKIIAAKNGKKGLNNNVLDHLHDSISKEGMFNPIVVRPATDKPGFYKIVQGEHRFYVVSKMMKEESIECRIFEDMSDEEAELAALTENSCRTHAKPADRLLTLRKWQEVYRKHFPHLEGKKASGHSRWSNSTKAEAKQKAIDEERAADEAERRRAAAESNGQNVHYSEGDAGQETAEVEIGSEEKPSGQQTFRERVKSVTGASDSTLTRDLKIINGLDEEQVYVLGLVQCTHQAMVRIIDATDDLTKRSDIVNLVASGMEIDEAIVEVFGDQAGKAETKKVGEVEPTAGPETEEEWFQRECGEFAGFLSDTEQYHAEAILYRRLRDERYEHRKRVKKIYEDFRKSRKGRRLGSFYWTVYNYLNASHPNSWVICGACKGKCAIDGEECSACRGAGYRSKSESYI
jgi:hypothetical protein